MASENKKPSVEYNFLSNNCGLKVSNICLGTMTFGTTKARVPMPGNLSEEGSHAILDRYAELGGNFIDTANVYTFGESETHIGTWLQKQANRDRYVIATKCRVQTDASDPNAVGLSRKHIVRSLEQSLERLQTDYIDLYQTHIWDSGVPLAETLHTLNDLVRCGKVCYVGASNLKGWQLQKIVDMNRHNGFPQFVSLQQQYNLLTRGMELELFDVCNNEGLGILPWSPLEMGLLTNKVNKVTKQPEEGSRTAAAQNIPVADALLGVTRTLARSAYWDIISKCEEIGIEHNKSIAQVALRWALQRKPVSSVIIGVKTVKQLEENMAAGAGWSLSDAQMVELNDVSSLEPLEPYSIIANNNVDRSHPGCMTGML